MSNLIVVFSKLAPRIILDGPPLEIGSAARTEQVAIGGSSAPGSLVAVAGEDVVDLQARADCWIAIGADPEAAAGTSPSRFLASGQSAQFWVNVGDKVAVITG